MQASGCTVLKNCVDRGKVADSIQVFMGPVFLVTRYLERYPHYPINDADTIK